MALKSQAYNYTYTELDRISGSMGDYIYRLLGDTAQPIALLLDDGVHLVSSLLGVLRSGHFYSILSSKNPPARTRDILNDLNTPLLITSASLLESMRELAPQGCRVLSFDETQKGNDSSFYREVSSDSHAAIYYTSGSTGEPKGVLRPRRLLVKRGLVEIEKQNIQPDDHLLLCYALSSTASLSTIFGTLFSGASLHIFDAEKTGVAPLKDLIWREKITHLRIPVELLRYFIDGLPADAFFPSIRYVISAGDVLYFSDLERLRKHINPDVWFTTQLGMSEFGSLASNSFRFDQPFDEGIVPLGLPMPGKEIIILGEDGIPLNSNEIGEVGLRTDVKFSGYWNRPDLTDAKMIPDPADSTRVIYRTGDLGRILPNGQLVLAGRKDQRVKIRGFSVDTSAVESVLMSIEGVRRGVVTAQQNPAGEKRLVAYVMPVKGEKLSAQSLRQALITKLPDFMLPSHYVLLADLPLTHTGKVDRKALPAPHWNRPERTTAFVAPRDEVEQKLVKAWRAVLRVDSIGIDDNFFELGGDSLMAASLMVSIEEVFSRRMPVAMMLKASTVRQQADMLRSDGVNLNEPLLIPIRTRGAKQPLFCLGGKGGTPIRFNRLFQYISGDRPVYYFRSRGLGADEKTEDFVEDIAADFINELKRVQPHGPYHFLGESSGGLVAYEMAQQLHLQGETIAFLGMLDTYISRYRSNNKPNWKLLLKKHSQTLINGGVKGLAAYFKYYAGLWNYKVYQLKDWAGQKWTRVRYREVFQKYDRVERANRLANRAYIPKPFSGTVHLFHAATQARYENNSPHNGWGDAGIEDLIIHSLECYHGNILFEPYVSQIAEIINQKLNGENQQSGAVSI
ncbi:MAG: AMP-binding protein [Chloroflexi bacterium]|nr:AMP-binding protein [Chloroflexota bacterium]